MRKLYSRDPTDPHLYLKRLLNEQKITAQGLSDQTGISYSRLVRILRNEQEFSASEIGTIAHRLGITDINKYFLGGRI